MGHRVHPERSVAVMLLTARLKQLLRGEEKAPRETAQNNGRWWGLDVRRASSRWSLVPSSQCSRGQDTSP